MAGPAAEMRNSQGFTLAEVLIALTLMGVVALFTIPKILQVQENANHNTIVKETLYEVASAFQAYSEENMPNGNTSMGDLSPFINYVRVDTTSNVDWEACAGTTTCSGPRVCLKLPNGAIMYYPDTMRFNNTAATNALKFHIDPDAKVTGGSGGIGKAVSGYIYLNGNILTRANILPNTANNINTDNPNPACDPSWFSWN